MADLVSILIPCYNAEKWLKQTIESALAQTWQNIEIIIVDDGSTDNSLQILKTYESRKVKVVSQENKGGSAARNKALEYAQGSYIQWLDADDILDYDKIKCQMQMANHLQNKKIALSSAWAEFYFRHHKAKFIPSNLWRNLDPVEWLIIKFSENVYMTNHSWLISRELTELAGPWNERLAIDQDGEYFSRVVANSEKIIFVPDARCYYRRCSPKSISGGFSDTSRESELLSRTLCIFHLRSIEDSERTKKASLQFLQGCLSVTQLKNPVLIQKANHLAYEMGGNLSNHRPQNLRVRIARAILGRALTGKARTFLWYVKVLIKANWDRLLYKLSI